MKFKPTFYENQSNDVYNINVYIWVRA